MAGYLCYDSYRIFWNFELIENRTDVRVSDGTSGAKSGCNVDLLKVRVLSKPRKSTHLLRETF